MTEKLTILYTGFFTIFFEDSTPDFRRLEKINRNIQRDLNRRDIRANVVEEVVLPTVLLSQWGESMCDLIKGNHDDEWSIAEEIMADVVAFMKLHKYPKTWVFDPDVVRDAFDYSEDSVEDEDSGGDENDDRTIDSETDASLTSTVDELADQMAREFGIDLNSVRVL